LDKGIYTAVSGAIAQDQKLQTISNNIANVDTVAFKKESPVFKEFVTALERQETVIDVPRVEFKPSDFYHLQGNEKSYVNLDSVTTDYEQGSFKRTANPMDFAISGEGFFEVNTPLGVRYTKAGNFTLDSQSRLVTMDGNPILAEPKKIQGADPALNNLPENREIKIRDANFEVRPDGTIMSAGAEVAKVNVVEFSNKEYLVKAGRNMFSDQPQAQIKDKTSSTVLQGYIEGSNVNPVQEMIGLISTQRTFDGLQNAIKAYSEMASKGTNVIGDLGQ